MSDQIVEAIYSFILCIVSLCPRDILLYKVIAQHPLFNQVLRKESLIYIYTGGKLIAWVIIRVGDMYWYYGACLIRYTDLVLGVLRIKTVQNMPRTDPSLTFGYLQPCLTRNWQANLHGVCPCATRSRKRAKRSRHYSSQPAPPWNEHVASQMQTRLARRTRSRKARDTWVNLWTALNQSYLVVVSLSCRITHMQHNAQYYLQTKPNSCGDQRICFLCIIHARVLSINAYNQHIVVAIPSTFGCTNAIYV